MKIPGDRILIEPIIPNEESGFVVNTNKQKPQTGKVVGVGRGKPNEPMLTEVGDIVLYAKGAGTTIEIDGKPLIFMRENDIFCAL